MPRDPLEAVYRLISSNSYLEAIHLINKQLKKQPNSLVTKIWKCEALHGLGNIAESEELMASILQQSPSDKKTVECMADFFRARGNYVKMVEVYENALKQDPSDENWRKALFECCGLAGDYKKQHQQALHLNKQNPRLLFYCMAVVCLLQQADENPLALELAERMMIKQSESGKLKSRNEVLLYLIVLEKRGKYEKALEILNQSESDLEALIATSDKRLELLIQLERWGEVLKVLKHKLREKPDHWNNLKQYVAAGMKLEQLGTSVDDPEIDDSFDRAKRFFLHLTHQNEQQRGPFLAILELVRCHSSENDNCSLGTRMGLIVDYFGRFGDKAICVFDLSQYVTLLPEASIPELLGKLSAPANDPKDHLLLQQTMGTLKHISYLQLSRYLGFNNMATSAEEREKLCDSLEKCFELANACQRSEHYVIFVAHERIAMFSSSGDATHLALAAAALEKAIIQMPIFALQVLLLQVYSALGASKSAKKLYEQLRIQSVQVDTLVHLFLCSISSTGHLAIASEMWDNALKILHQCTAECLEALVWCYRSGLYHRVEEFTSCARRFQNTITTPMLRCERIFLDLLTGEPAKAEQILGRLRTSVVWDDCIDNRDLKALPSWDPPSLHRPKDQSYSELLLFCKVRERTLLCLNAAIAYSKQRGEEKNFVSALDSLRALYAEAAVIASKPTHQFHLLTSCSTRLPLIIQVPLPSMLEKVMEPELPSSDKLCMLLKQSTDDCIAVVERSKTKNPRLVMEHIVTQMEGMAVITVAVGAARAKLSPVARRRSGQIVTALEACWLSLDGLCSSLDMLSNFPDNDGIRATLLDNYQTAIEDVRKSIRKKVAYLHKLSPNN